MKRILFFLFVVTVLSVSSQVSAQSFFKKLTGSLKNNTKEVASTDSNTNVVVSDSTVKIKWDAIPVYSVQKVNVTGADGQPLLNEDGTPQVRVFLVDQFGNKRSKEAVKAQQKKLWAAIGKIAGKVGIGALGGGLLSGDVEGAITGAAMGAVASADDIKMAVAQKKSLKKQQKLLEAYEKNFSDEGIPVDAKADFSKIKDLDLDENNALSMNAEDIKKEIESENFNTTDDSAWEV